MDNEEIAKELKRLGRTVSRLTDLLERYDHDTGKPGLLARIDTVEDHMKWAYFALVIEAAFLIAEIGYIISLSMR